MSLRSRARTALHPLVLLFVLGAAATCGRGAEERTAPSAPATVTAPAPAPAPDGLLGEVVVRAPQSLWDELRTALGTAGASLPKSLGSGVAASFALPLAVAAGLDGSRPIVAALGVSEGALGGALAARVKSGEALVRELTLGRDPSHEAVVEGGVTVLRPRRAPLGDLVPSLGVVDDHVVLASSERALAEYGRYLARTLARAAPPDEALVATLAPIALRTGARELVERTVGALRARLLATPVAGFVDLEAATAAVRDLLDGLTGVRITAGLAGDRVRIGAELAGRVFDTGPDAVAADLLAMPGDSLLAAAWGEGLPARTQMAARSAAQLAGGLGSAVGEPERVALREALELVAAGRGDHAAIGLRCTGMGLTALATGDLAAADRARRGLEALLALADRKLLDGWLAPRGLGFAHRRTRVANVPLDVERVRLAPRAPAERPPVAPAASSAGAAPAPPPARAATPVDLLLALGDARFALAAGAEADDGLGALFTPKGTLAEVPTSAPALGALPGPARWLVWVDSAGVAACLAGKPGSRAPAQALLALGRRTGGDGAGWVALDAPVQLLAEVLALGSDNEP
ncbi:MAG: hypothetical protein IT373_28725 [Polyangiaceae bacterium]|nr:hypothetical protein [Polyangiaceae bacterium]